MISDTETESVDYFNGQNEYIILIVNQEKKTLSDSKMKMLKAIECKQMFRRIRLFTSRIN